VSVTEWWTVQHGNWIGPIGGAAAGVLGGLLGSAIGVCAPRGILKTPVIAAHMLISLACAGVLGAGIFANLSGQPSHVFYPLMLAGSIGMGVLGGLLPVTLFAYRIADARKQIEAAMPGDPNLAAPNPAMIRAIVDSWGSGGSLRSLSLTLAAAMGVLMLVGGVTGVTLLVNGSPFRSWFGWSMVAICTGVAAVLCWMLPRMLLATANAARGVLDQQRLAAEEFRRG